MIRHIFALMVLLATAVANGSLAADQPKGTGESPVSVNAAVEAFNKSNADAADWADQSPVTEPELIAALVHEKKALSADSQKAAEEIIETRTFPPAVQLRTYRRHFADRHATYVYKITLSFDKGPVQNENGENVEGRRRTESVTIRNHYLATQERKAGQELKPLEALLTEATR